MVQFLTSLDQNGNIGLASLETEMEKLLEYIVIFNPPGEENVSFYLSYHLGYVHTAHSSVFFLDSIFRIGSLYCHLGCDKVISACSVSTQYIGYSSSDKCISAMPRVG